jgi:hypothetical protein
MRNVKWTIAALCLCLAAPAFADDTAKDAKDTATETGANMKKGARDLKPGDKTAGDRMDDAKDTATAKKAKAKKKARHAKKKAQNKVDETTK